MQAFIKDKTKLIVNSQILDNEKQDLVEFVKLASKGGVSVTPLYDLDGEISGIQFKSIAGSFVTSVSISEKDK